ncbi:MAG: DeoR/GlpR family DNA-binding transcription regulator [Acidimicrobiales bacterium]
MQAIRDILDEEATVGVDELAATLAVSPATVRRDLARLEARGHLIRSHGGAVRVDRGYEVPIGSRVLSQAVQKRRIALMAAELVADGAVVGITGGTTTMEVARALANRADLTVVTNALNVGAELALRRNIRLVVTGGVARSASFELSGPVAERTIREYNLDFAFVGVDGVDPVAGFTTHNDLEALTNAALVKAANLVVVVADSTKLGQLKFARICDVDAVDILVTDAGASEDHVRALQRAGLTVKLA